MRNYGQFCPVARASEILAERWTPIIVRNLLVGCRTFNEIAAGAPGLSRGLLARRLGELERAGLIQVRPKPQGRGSLYEPTPAGRELWDVLRVLGDWAERWIEVAIEHAEPGAVLWSWCESFLRRDVLPERRVVVRFEFRDLNQDRGSRRAWLLIERQEAEICDTDPGFGDDLVVVIHDPLTFARWHLGLVDWHAAVRSGAIGVTGPRQLTRALPTWNGGPAVHARARREHQRVPGSDPPPPQGAVDTHRRVPPLDVSHRAPKRVDLPGFDGQLVTADDPDYDDVRAVWNGAIDRRPRYIARCRSTSDVAAALRFAREWELPVSVRAGGHGVAGDALCDDGLVVDLTPMKTITVDASNHTATVGAGVVWSELDATTQAFGLATTGGTHSQTGVSGLTLGGGIGWLMRRHGVTVDNLLAAEVLTADGRRLNPDEHEHPELFWALRGGGAGLGVVTSFTYRLHRVGPEVLSGPVMWTLEDAPEVLDHYRQFAASAPPEVCTVVTLRRAPAAPYLPVELHRRPVCVVVMLALGDAQRSERLLASMRTFGRPLLDLVKFRPYTKLQSMFDGGAPSGWHYYWKSTGLQRLDDGVIETLVDRAAEARSPHSYSVLFQLGGAVGDVDSEATAYSRRNVAYELNVNAVWRPQERIADAEAAWARALVASLEPHQAGQYLNFLGGDDRQRRSEAFTPTAYRRLLEIRRHFDPDQVFRPAVAKLEPEALPQASRQPDLTAVPFPAPAS